MALDVQIQQLAEYEKNKWIPIETPPTGCSSVILKFDPADLEEIGCSNCAYTARYYLKNGSFYDLDHLDEWQIKPTHWQPMSVV